MKQVAGGIVLVLVLWGVYTLLSQGDKYNGTIYCKTDCPFQATNTFDEEEKCVAWANDLKQRYGATMSRYECKRAE